MTALPHRHRCGPASRRPLPREAETLGGGAHPGARASRPHALPLPAAQFPCDGAPVHPAGRNAMGPAIQRTPPRAARAMGGAHPGARASRPHALPLRTAQFPCDVAPGHPAGGNAIGPAEAEPRRRCRSDQVEEMGRAVPGFVRAGRPHSRSPSFHDVVAAKEVHRSSCPFVVRLDERSAISPLKGPHRSSPASGPGEHGTMSLK